MELEPWSKSFPLALRSMVPLLGARYLRDRKGISALRVLRAFVIGVSVSLVLILWILVQFIGTKEGGVIAGRLWPWEAALALTPLGIAWFRRRQVAAVVAADPDAVVGAYRASTFALLAVAETPALVAYITFFYANTVVPLLITVPIALGLVAFISPREGAIRRLQEEITAHGGIVDLATALMTPYGAGQSGP